MTFLVFSTIYFFELWENISDYGFENLITDLDLQPDSCHLCNIIFWVYLLQLPYYNKLPNCLEFILFNDINDAPLHRTVHLNPGMSSFLPRLC